MWSCTVARDALVQSALDGALTGMHENSVAWLRNNCLQMRHALSQRPTSVSLQAQWSKRTIRLISRVRFRVRKGKLTDACALDRFEWDGKYGCYASVHWCVKTPEWVFRSDSVSRGVVECIRSVVLYKHAEPLRSIPSFFRTSFLPNVAESKNGLGLRVSDDLRRIPNMVPLNPRGSIELSLKTTGLDSVVSV